MIRVEVLKLVRRPRTWVTIAALNALPTLVAILLAVIVAHLFFIALWGRLPRLAGWALVASYGVFLWFGLLK